MHAVAGLPLQPAKLEILFDAHAREKPAALRHIADAKARMLRRGLSDQLSFPKRDRSARGWRYSDQRLEQRRLAGARCAREVRRSRWSCSVKLTSLRMWLLP